MNHNERDTSDARKKAIQLLAAALELDASEIPPDAAFGNLACWDSLAHMRLIMAIEGHLEAALPPDVMVAIGSLADVEAVLRGEQPSARNW